MGWSFKTEVLNLNLKLKFKTEFNGMTAKFGVTLAEGHWGGRAPAETSSQSPYQAPS